MPLICSHTENHPGIPGVDGLRGDDPFEVGCDAPALYVAEYREEDDQSTATITYGFCSEHGYEPMEDYAMGADVFNARRVGWI